MHSEIAIADGEESDDEMLLPESIRGAFLFRRSGRSDPENTVLSGTSPGGRIFRKPRLRKMGSRKRLAELGDDEVLDDKTRYRRERKRVRRQKEVPKTPPPPTADVPPVLEDETLDLEGSMEWNGEPAPVEQQQDS
jgi:hypothetical protein